MKTQVICNLKHTERHSIPVIFSPGPRGPLLCMFQMSPCPSTPLNDQLIVRLC